MSWLFHLALPHYQWWCSSICLQSACLQHSLSKRGSCLSWAAWQCWMSSVLLELIGEKRSFYFGLLWSPTKTNCLGLHSTRSFSWKVTFDSIEWSGAWWKVAFSWAPVEAVTDCMNRLLCYGSQSLLEFKLHLNSCESFVSIDSNLKCFWMSIGFSFARAYWLRLCDQYSPNLWLCQWFHGGWCGLAWLAAAFNC